jgi:hypothetical protein
MALMVAFLSRSVSTALLVVLLAITLLPALLIILLFGTMTVTVDDERVTVHFGPGIPGLRLPLSRILHVARVHTRWYWGWGIRITPDGTLYSVSTGDAVALRLNDGSVILVGSDQPEHLLEAIRARLGFR